MKLQEKAGYHPAGYGFSCNNWSSLYEAKMIIPRGVVLLTDSLPSKFKGGKMKINVTLDQAIFLSDAVEWAVGDGMSPPNKEQSQILISLHSMVADPNSYKEK